MALVRAEWGWGGVGLPWDSNYSKTRPGYKDKPSRAE